MSQTRAAAPATHASEALGIDVVPDADILRKAAAGQGFELNNAAAAQTFSGAGGGTPLDAQVQRQMESGFGQSLGDVRVTSWADYLRGNKRMRTVFPDNDRWHYLDADVHGEAEAFQPTADGNDVVSQVER